MNADEVVRLDLDSMCADLKEEFSCLSGRRLLITGGAGFLGHYFIQSALHWNNHVHAQGEPIQVVVYDSFVRGMPQWLSRIEADRNLVLVRHDIRNPLPADAGDFQFIIHAASIASPTYYKRDPIGTMDANVNGLRMLLEYARGQNEKGRPVEAFLFFSSSEIYGDPSPENIPTPETYRGLVSCTGPRACYDEAKRYGETLCVNFAHQFRIPVKVARPFNNYGPGLKISDRRVIPDFARNIMDGRDLVMLSDGSPRRTFCYAADAVTGYYKVLIKGHVGEAYNIGVEVPEISMAELAEKLASLAKELFGYKGKVIRQPSPDTNYLIDNPNRRCPVITKARLHLGYNPTVILGEGLKRSLIWYNDNRDAPDA
ncbi:MAG: NAD-dependent epimerase/dehydratase family protein [Nitrospira sp.]|nr:NAD-dependent epimerase/dehydratase family protein [Nitrospira sp.]